MLFCETSLNDSRVAIPYKVMNEYTYHGDVWQTVMIGKRLFEKRKDGMVVRAVRLGRGL